MEWQETHGHLLRCLHREWRASSIPTAEIEERLEICEGYFGKLCRGEYSFRLDLFLGAIDALGLDPAAFFARALDVEPGPEDALWQLEDSRDVDRGFQRMAHAARELETAEPPAADARATATAGDVAAVAACSRKEQLRRLSVIPKYRNHAFARAYLQHLDSLRYDHAELAARLATRVAVRLIPALPGPREERLSLLCLAFGVFGSARRQKGRFALAARVLRRALELSRRAGLREDRGNLLMRAAYVLKDLGRLNRALALVREATEIFVCLGSRWNVGRTLVDRGMIHIHLGEFEDALLGLEQALEQLSGSEEQMTRNHLSAYQYAAYAYEQLGALDKAHDCLEKGTKAFPPEHAVDAAKLQWVRGRLAARHGDYGCAEGLLRGAAAVLASKDDPAREAKVTLDLISVLLAQGKDREAADLAAGMAPLLFRFEENTIGEAAILELINAATESRLKETVVAETRRKLEGERTPRGALPRR